MIAGYLGATDPRWRNMRRHTRTRRNVITDLPGGHSDRMVFDGYGEGGRTQVLVIETLSSDNQPERCLASDLSLFFSPTHWHSS